uniref:Uncharacterized protein n=1 Tax=Steinernema glaseri TaxID=37863 RepID=A0A1I7YI08_9BILA
MGGDNPIAGEAPPPAREPQRSQIATTLARRAWQFMRSEGEDGGYGLNGANGGGLIESSELKTTLLYTYSDHSVQSTVMYAGGYNLWS